jgi:uncharacterized protein YcbK (DUF882 family)
MTEHFTDDELACKCGCGLLPQPDFMVAVDLLRKAYGKPMPVSSGARCPEYNDKVSKTGRSGPHTTGRALDITVRGADALRLIALAYAAGFHGIGVSQKGESRFIHIDDLDDAPGRPRPHIWSY